MTATLYYVPNQRYFLIEVGAKNAGWTPSVTKPKWQYIHGRHDGCSAGDERQLPGGAPAGRTAARRAADDPDGAVHDGGRRSRRAGMAGGRRGAGRGGGGRVGVGPSTRPSASRGTLLGRRASAHAADRQAGRLQPAVPSQIKASHTSALNITNYWAHKLAASQPHHLHLPLAATMSSSRPVPWHRLLVFYIFSPVRRTAPAAPARDLHCGEQGLNECRRNRTKPMYSESSDIGKKRLQPQYRVASILD